MDISKEQARESLSQIEEAAERTKKMMACSGGDAIFILWGFIWVLGYLGTHFLLQNASWPRLMGAGWLWSVLVVAGVIITLVMVRRHMPVRSSVRSRLGKRISRFWWLLFAYFYVWMVMLHPFIEVNGPGEAAALYIHLSAVAATVAMFAYVVVGLWLDHFMIWIGLGVTALTVLGLFLLQPYFCVWMAVAGGGTLIGTGLTIRNRWRQPCPASTS